VASAAFVVLSYLSMTTQRPLVDDALMAADRAIGFDWLGSYRVLLKHGTFAAVLKFIYNSLFYQGLYFGVLFGLMGKRQNLREMFWLVFIAGVFTSAGAALFPALGPFNAFHIDAKFLPDMQRLHSGERHFVLAKLTGVVSFPSFHTTMALLYIYAFSRAGLIGWAAAALNLLMIPAIPFFGGHYLVDMIAGGAVGLASLAIVNAWPQLSVGRGERLRLHSRVPPNEVAASVAERI
jgi:membrane-associated phospholipid phosphatase